MADKILTIEIQSEPTIEIDLEDIEVIETPRTVDTEMSDTSENPVQNKVIKSYVDDKVKTDVPVGAKFTDTVYTHPASHPASMITGLPTSLPANGGNADTVGGFTVGVNVPANAKFTDTVYSHPASHPASIITQDTNNRFVSDNEKGVWNGKQDALGFTPVNTTDSRLSDARTPTAHNHDGTYQLIDADLTAIAGLTGTSGLLKKTAANTWSLDTSTYSLSTHNHNGTYQASDADLTAIAALAGTSGLLRKTAANTWSLDEPVQIKRW